MLVFEILLIIVLLYIIWLFLYSMLFGAPYAAIGKKRLNTMVKLAKVRKGEKSADLGSGDGRIIIAFAKAGAIADGYEINPLLYFLSNYHVKRRKISNATTYLKDLWQVDFRKYDIISLYGNFPMMGRLEKKLQKELRPGARVVSNHFQFPHWKYTKRENDVYVYIR